MQDLHSIQVKTFMEQEEKEKAQVLTALQALAEDDSLLSPRR